MSKRRGTIREVGGRFCTKHKIGIGRSLHCSQNNAFKVPIKRCGMSFFWGLCF